MSINTLGQRYGLSPTTLAGLAQIKGEVPAAQTIDIDEWAADAEDSRHNPYGAPAPAAVNEPTPAGPHGWKFENGRAVDGPVGSGYEAGPKVDPSAPQGPADAQDFPTVRTLSASPEVLPAGYGAGPARTTPAHWQPNTSSVQRESTQYDPEQLGSYGEYKDAGAGLGLLAGDARLEATQRNAQADALYAAAHTAASQRAAERLEVIQQQKAAYVRDERAKLDKLANEVATSKVDYNEAWGGTLGRVMGAIAVGLGQFGASLRGGPNTAWQIVKEGIDSRVAAQKEGIAAKGKMLERRQSLFDRNLAAFGDRERAVLATKIQYLDQVSGMVEGQKALAKSKDAEAAAFDLQKRIMDERAATADHFLDLTKQKTVEQDTEKYVAAQTGGPGQKGKEGLYVPTLGGYARDEKTAQTLNNKGSLRMQMTENMREISELMERAKGLNSVTSPLEVAEIDKRIEALVNDTLTKNTVIEGQGAMSKDDKEVAAAAKQLTGLSVQGRPNFMIDKQQQRVKESAARVLKHHRLDGEANGIQVGTEVYRQGPSGPEPVRVLEGRNKIVTKNTEGYDDLVQKPKGVPQGRR
jgi:hypothetical protein